MGSSAIKNPRRIFSQAGSDASLTSRVTAIENAEFKITYFESVSAASGTVTKPVGSTILTDQFQGGIDAYVSTIVNGQPTGILPQTAGGVDIDVTSFNSSGDWVLTGTPSAYPVAIIYVISIPALYLANAVVANRIDLEETQVGLNEIAYGSTNGVTSSSKLLWDQSNSRLRAGGTSVYITAGQATTYTGHAGMYANALPATANYFIISNTVDTHLNGTSTVNLMVNDVNKFAINSSGSHILGPVFIGSVTTNATALLHLGASTTSQASLRIASGIAPTTPNAGDIWNDGSYVNFVDGVSVATAKSIRIRSGSNQRAGNATLVGGTITVNNTTVTANTIVILTKKTDGGTIGTDITYTISAGNSFTINSDNALDTSTFSYLLIEVS